MYFVLIGYLLRPCITAIQKLTVLYKIRPGRIIAAKVDKD